MAKLTNVKPRLGGLSTRIGQSPQSERERDYQRAESNPLRALYKTARWQKLRRKILKRDHYLCQKTGVLVTGKYPEPDSAVIDHIEPHRGDERLFWDEANLQVVSKAYHDSAKQALDQSAIKGVWY